MSEKKDAEKNARGLAEQLVDHFAEEALKELVVYGCVMIQNGQIIRRDKWQQENCKTKPIHGVVSELPSRVYRNSP